ncbi:MAG: beta-galactosidase [Lachnospiraceae bacterium]|nr:beta-galactosidase [Lachnospiraceae bacterium]
MDNVIDLTGFKGKEIWDLGEDFSGISSNGDKISFNNYYMLKNGTPFYGISGEFHMSRMDDSMWEDEIAKIKMCGINVIATYVFWNHIEEEEGRFDFSGRRDVRKFIELCGKYGLYVILRVGPFDHGEVRNGGLPDWLYGKPFECRQLNEGFLYYTRRLYTEIAGQVKGLFFKDGGPVIGTQIDNEYMHSSAPWEITTGISDEWVFGGNEGDAYMLELKRLAAECGLTPVFYTCTGWGGASAPENMMPLWGGYAFQPWLFYSYKGEHPSTQEYVYQDLHNNEIPKSYNFEPKYKPEDKPYACCEMGGGMTCSYYYRFQLPYKSIDAMANIKMASGCNFLGYYMFQGGSNPVGKNGVFMNEGQVPKISYDYQAALGEYGQVRESYTRLKTMHYFAETYQEKLCGLKTMLPDGASQIAPKDLDTLRFAVRTDGKRGFLFINNYQDHEVMPAKENENITLKLADGDITFENIGIDTDENCILPFNFDMEGINLEYATAQPVTYMQDGSSIVYIFMRPDGMKSQFIFEEGVLINGNSVNRYSADTEKEADIFTVSKGEAVFKVICISRGLSNKMYKLGNKGFLFAEDAVMVKEGSVYLETYNNQPGIYTYPVNLLAGSIYVEEAGAESRIEGFGFYKASANKVQISPELKEVAANRYTVAFPENFMQGVKDVLLRINYQGDIGHAFIDGNMINDNFCNGAVWEIGLRTFEDRLKEHPLVIYVTPLKEGAKVNVESAMAARIEEVETTTGEINSIEAVPVYELKIL